MFYSDFPINKDLLIVITVQLLNAGIFAWDISTCSSDVLCNCSSLGCTGHSRITLMFSFLSQTYRMHLDLGFLVLFFFVRQGLYGLELI